jgi:hypothetical protein
LVKAFTFPALIAVLLLSFAVFGSHDGARADETRDTSASVGGAGANPRIECAWILPDATTSAANPQTMEYGNDDNVAAPSPTPCTSDGTQPATQANVPGPPTAQQIHIHVNPNPENLPNTQLLELWGAVDPPSGTAAAWTGGAFWKVFHPNGSLKVQVESTKITPQGSGGCGQATGLSAALASMFDAADNVGPIGTGQLTQQAVNSIVALCQQNGKALYRGTFELHKDQACGNYRVEFNATGGAQTQVLNYWFNVPCLQQLQIDFTAVNWGNIIPGQPGQVLGDIVFSVPPCIAQNPGTCPTVKNVSNSGMGLQVVFSVMQQCSTSTTDPCVEGSVPGAKEIIDFDGCFGRTPSTIQCIDPAPAAGTCSALTNATSVSTGEDAGCRNRTFTFDTSRDRTLCANEVGKLDLSIHPVLGLPAGNYAGDLTVIGLPQIAQQYCGENAAPGGGA